MHSRMLVFGSVMIAIVGSLHYYFWARLVRDTVLGQPYRALATVGIALLGVSLPAMLLLYSRLPGRVVGLLAWPAYLWLGFMMLLFLSLLGADLVRLFARIGGFDPGRRELFHRVLGAGAATLAASYGGLAIWNALSPAKVKRISVSLGRLPRGLDGLTMVQLTDLHVGPTIGKAWLDDVVARTNALAPDVVAITGDLVDGPVERLRDAVSSLARLKAKHGVFFVTGNHEYYAGAVEWERELSRLGVRVLRNERVSIGGDGGGGGGEGKEGSFDLAGVDDFNSLGFAPGHGPDLARALAGRDPSRECVLLAHQPRAIHEAARLGVGLQLSGHTHGGQVWPWNFFVRLQQPYVAGHFREGDTQLYVSKGTGYWGPPMRMGADAEITHITLRSSAAQAA